MAGWHHRLDGHEFEQTPGVGDGQGGLACCGPRGHKESDTTERPNYKDVPPSAITHRATRGPLPQYSLGPHPRAWRDLDLASDTLALWAAGR